MSGFRVAVLGVAAWLTTTAMASAADLTLKGLGGEARAVSQAEMKALPHLQTSVGAPGAGVRYDAVKVAALLALVGVKPDDGLGRTGLARVMVFTASDGYVVVLPLSDLDPEFHPGDILVADARDGKPLDDKEGPFRLVVEGDKRPARSARNLVGIEVKAVK